MVVGRWRGGEGRRRRKKKKEEKEKIDAWMYNTADQTGGEVEGGGKKRLHCICTSRSRPCMLRERERRKINVTIHTTLNKTRYFQHDMTWMMRVYTTTVAKGKDTWLAC
jgi:hypothetical protein